MPDWLARVLRTFLQAFIGAFLLLTAAPLAEAAKTGVIPDTDIFVRGGVAGLFAGAIALVSLVQNVIEQSSGKAILKPPLAQHDRVT